LDIGRDDLSEYVPENYFLNKVAICKEEKEKQKENNS
jgi:hypothetical protein